MNLIKAAGLTLIPFVTVFFCSYLIGSFISVSFNPANWTMDLRMYMSVCGACMGIAVWFNFSARGLYDGPT
jgi:hypothetical protein